MGKRRAKRKQRTVDDSHGVESAGAARSPVHWRFWFVVLFLLFGVGAVLVADWRRQVPDALRVRYVGRARCIECHEAAGRSYHGSDHDLAMDRATPATVLGDFDNATLTHHGITSRMFRRDGKYMIHTEGPDGRMGDFEIRYVFGVRPLQQYMVEFDRTPDMKENEVGRLQVLRISWDTERKRWFYLPPPDVEERILPDDPLHWTGIAQRWNTMCADCHSTNLHRGYDVKTGRYRTTFSDIDVSCEACHGPGGGHVAVASRWGLFWDRKHGKDIVSYQSMAAHRQVESCAPCHSRRSAIHPDYRAGAPYHDFFQNELLEPETYFADGQVLDEDYVYGSFLQTKMFHKDVRCTDCHDAHTTRLKHEGNAVCTSCHQHPAGKYDTPAHHHHQPGSTGSRCVECHIPETTYMEVDARRDHGFRVPRPDLSLRIPVPNACTGCHLDRARLAEPARKKLKQYRDWVVARRDGDEQVAAALREVDQWCADALARWYPDLAAPPDFPRWLHAASRQERGVLPHLLDTAADVKLPAIVRATLFEAADRLRSSFMRPDDQVAESFDRLARRLLHDRDPQVRMVAVRSFTNHIMATGSRPLNDESKARAVALLRPTVDLLTPLLEDPRRVVRIEAARVLQRIPPPVRPDLLYSRQREALRRATQELMQHFDLHADRAGSHLSKALVFEAMGRDADAIAAYETAMRVEPNTAGARSNLAGLLERMAEVDERAARNLVMQRGPREEAERILRRAFDDRQRAARLRAEELPLLARDAKLAPRNAAVQYRYGLALYLAGQAEAAESYLRRAVKLAPRSERYVETLAVYYRDFQMPQKALPWAERLQQLDPGNPRFENLLKEIRQQIEQGVQPRGTPRAEPEPSDGEDDAG